MSSHGKHKVTWVSMPLVLLLVAGFTACTFTHTYELKGTLENPPNVDQLPVTVGVLYSPELVAYKHVNSKPHHMYIVPLGEPSVRLFDEVFGMMFEKVERVSSRPPLKTLPAGLVAVIEPRIEEFRSDFPAMVAFSFTAYVEVVYRFTLYSLDGTPFASWIVEGEGQETFPLFVGSQHWVFLGLVSGLALQHAAIKFMTGFRDVPEVRRWLRETGVPE